MHFMHTIHHFELKYHLCLAEGTYNPFYHLSPIVPYSALDALGTVSGHRGLLNCLVPSVLASSYCASELPTG